MNLNDVPRDKNYPPGAVQCDTCGGCGCPECEQRGWYADYNHPRGRKCANPVCNNKLHPAWVAVYCTEDCALADL